MLLQKAHCVTNHPHAAASAQSPIGARRRLGAELRRLRTKVGLTLDDVADRMTCSTSKISRLETGKWTDAPDSLYLALSKAYQIPVSDFLPDPAGGTP